MMLFGNQEPSEDKISKFKLGNLLVSTSVDELARNPALPHVIILDESRDEPFIFGQEVFFDESNLEYFEDSHKEKMAFLPRGSYSLGKIQQNNLVDLSRFGLKSGEVDFSKRTVFYSPRLDKIRDHQGRGDQRLMNDMAFTIVIGPNNRYFIGFPNRGFGVNHQISYRLDDSNIELNAFMPNTPCFDSYRVNGFEVRELEQDLGKEMKSPSELKALLEYLVK